MMNRLFAFPVLLLAVSPAIAADANGYTAQYECRAGGPYCNVDVSTLVNQPCQQIISASTPWSAINWSNNVICIEAGDHTSKGTLSLQSSGTLATHKILRYHRPNDSNEDPWDQSTANQARVYGINTAGRDFWVVHRLTFDANYGSVSAVQIPTGTTDVIFNRTLVQRTDNAAVAISGTYGTADTNNIWLQNSVVRNTKPRNDAQENQCITVSNAENVRIVNNEMLDCNKGVHVPGYSTAYGLVVENNDVYSSTASFSDCNGNLTTSGRCGRMEVGIGLKSGATAAKPARIIQNRIWALKPTDPILAQDGLGDSAAISLSNQDINGQQNPNGGADYVLVRNNIIFESQLGIWNYWGGPDHGSIVGNIFYKIRYDTIRGGGERGAISIGRWRDFEVYLNTIVDSDTWLRYGYQFGNNDIRCNAVLSSAAVSGSAGPGDILDATVYYDTSHANELLRLQLNIVTRANSTTYAPGTIARWSAIGNCTSPSSPACFLYRATNGGTTAPTSTTPCTSLGCTFGDGGITWQAIRGPYTFYRKLRTAREPYTIPYARTHITAPETNMCPQDFARRAGVGIDDSF